MLAAGTLLARYSGGDDGASDSAALGKARVQSFEMVLTANGDLDARDQTVLRSELETRTTIVEIVEEGSLVEKDEVLVRLSADELQKQLDNEMLSLESAKSDLVSAQNSVEIQKSDNASSLNKAQLRAEIARLDMEKWLRGDDKEKQTQLALDIDSARREAERLQEKLERSRELFAEEFLSSDELKQDELASIKAASALEKAELRQSVYMEYERTMELKKKQNEIDEAEAELERVKRRNDSQLASKQADVTNRQRQLSLRQERVDKLVEQIEATVVRAPTAGLVVFATSMNQRWWDNSGPLKVGSEVRPNEDLIVLPNNEEMVAKVNIHESLVGQVSKGQRCRVKIDAARGELFDGTVESVGVIAEQGGWRDPNLREYEVRILLDLKTRDHGLKPSMRCEAEIVTGRVEDALAVPVQAVFQEGPVSYVCRPSSGKYERVPVALGRRSSTLIEVVAGIEDGETLLLRRPEEGELLGTREFDKEALARVAAASEAAKKKMAGDRKPADSGEESGEGVVAEGKGAESAVDVSDDAGSVGVESAATSTEVIESASGS